MALRCFNFLYMLGIVLREKIRMFMLIELKNFFHLKANCIISITERQFNDILLFEGPKKTDPMPAAIQLELF